MDKIDKWHLDRFGKFTASESYKLLTPAKPNELWSTGAKTYIEEKAIQSVSNMWERPELEEVASLLHGRVHELPAFESYVSITRNHSMTYFGSEEPVFLDYELLTGESGGTPDAANILDSGNIDLLCEIKCPRNPVYHFRRLKWVDQWDVKKEYPLVYCQAQHLLLITNAIELHFVSFDDRQRYKKAKTKIIEIKPDKKFQDNLHIRLEMASKEKYKLISSHLEADVKCKADLVKLIA